MNTTEMELLKSYKLKIQNQIPDLDVINSYSHNLISLYLRTIDDEFGEQVVNDTIVELGLDNLGWKIENCDNDLPVKPLPEKVNGLLKKVVSKNVKLTRAMITRAMIEEIFEQDLTEDFVSKNDLPIDVDEFFLVEYNFFKTETIEIGLELFINDIKFKYTFHPGSEFNYYVCNWVREHTVVVSVNGIIF